MEWLKEIRRETGKTQECIAEEAGISRAAYSNIEVGIRRPSPEVAKRIATAMGFDWTRFYEEEPEPEAG